MNNNLFNLKKRYFLVTGASGLLGKKHCEAILSANGIPVAIDLDYKNLLSLKLEVQEKYNLDFPIYACSVTEIDQLHELKKFLNHQNIFLSGIINNAAIKAVDFVKKSPADLENMKLSCEMPLPNAPPSDF